MEGDFRGNPACQVFSQAATGYVFGRTAPVASALTTSRIERWQADIDYMVTWLPKLHVDPFHAVSRATWENAAAELRAHWAATKP